jgi:hypothetical protein
MLAAIPSNKVPLHRFPKFELSYETISHKKVPCVYQVELAIPVGKKYFIWFTFEEKRNICLLMELGKDKRIGKISEIIVPFSKELAFGTVLYGTIVQPNIQTPTDNNSSSIQVFIIEDIFYYKGIEVRNHTWNEKLGAIDNFYNENADINKINQHTQIQILLPLMWETTDNTNISSGELVGQQFSKEIEDNTRKSYISNCGYAMHHIQYRSLTQVVPYINMSAKQKPNLNVMEDKQKIALQTYSLFEIEHPMNYSKPQYKYTTVFLVTADIQYDVYHLWAYGQYKKRIYCGVMGIPNYEKSVFMNGLFRNIRENENLDYIEESDDEEDFENVDLAKYVNMEKTVNIECVFNRKFRKWMPVCVAPSNAMIVHINKLANA